MSAISKQIPTVDCSEIQIISHSEIQENAAGLDRKLAAAAKQGFFLLQVGQEMRDEIEAGREFAKTFYTDDELKARDLPGFSGYMARTESQVEHFYCEKQLWDEQLPQAVAKLAKTEDELALLILDRMQGVLGVSQELWKKALGNLGQRHFNLNHYRASQEALIGFKPHKDFGFISILDTPAAGLSVCLDRKWQAMEPTEGSLIILFGRALEVLVNDRSRLTANLHRVESQSNDERTSVQITFDGCEDQPVYKLSKDGKSLESVAPNYTAYLKACFAELHAPGKLSQ